MSDIQAELRRVDRITTPDLWPEIASREPRSQHPRESRLLVIALALVVCLAAGALLWAAFRTVSPSTAGAPRKPSSSTSPPPRATGTITYSTEGWSVEIPASWFLHPAAIKGIGGELFSNFIPPAASFNGKSHSPVMSIPNYMPKAGIVFVVWPGAGYPHAARSVALPLSLSEFEQAAHRRAGINHAFVSFQQDGQLYYAGLWWGEKANLTQASEVVSSLGAGFTLPTVSQGLGPAPMNCGSLVTTHASLKGAGVSTSAIGSGQVLGVGFGAPGARAMLQAGQARPWPVGYPAKVLLVVPQGQSSMVSLSGTGPAGPLWFEVANASGPTTTALLPSVSLAYPGGHHPGSMVWKFYPSYVFVPQAGCYEIAASWPGGGWTETFAAGG